MRLHFLQHVPFETPGAILQWAGKKSDIIVSSTALFDNQPLPPLEQIDSVLVMGGPMSVHDESSYPWLTEEKKFIYSAISQGKRVMGICLGAQLIASVLGATVRKHTEKEIGWFPVQLTEKGKVSPFFRGFPEQYHAFHWHGETFDIPWGAKLLATTEGCTNQAFAEGPNVLGLQYHLESTPEGVEALLTHCADEMNDDRFVQSPEHIRELTAEHSVPSNALAATLFDQWTYPDSSR